MESIKNIFIYQKREVFKRGVIGLIFIIVNSFYPIINQYRENTAILTSFVDTGINFNKYFIIPYIIWYGYVFGFIAFLFIVDGECYYKLSIALIFTMLLSFVIFIYFPTYVPRPEVSPVDLISKLVLAIYSQDKPYNCLPSAHVTYSLLVAFYVSKSENIKGIVKVASSFVCILIILSTLYVKQHYFLDLVTGVIISYLIFIIIEILWKEKELKTIEL